MYEKLDDIQLEQAYFAITDDQVIEEKRFIQQLKKFKLSPFTDCISYDEKVIHFYLEYPCSFDVRIIPFMEWLLENYPIRVYCDRGWEWTALIREYGVRGLFQSNPRDEELTTPMDETLIKIREDYDIRLSQKYHQ